MIRNAVGPASLRPAMDRVYLIIEHMFP